MRACHLSRRRSILLHFNTLLSINLFMRLQKKKSAMTRYFDAAELRLEEQSGLSRQLIKTSQLSPLRIESTVGEENCGKSQSVPWM